MTRKSEIRLGVIGAGRIAPHHIRAALANGFLLDSICGRDFSKNAQSLGKQYGFKKTCSTFEELLARQVDAYLVLTETSAQIEIARELVKRDKPILVEKPVSRSPEQIEALEKIDTNQRIAVGYNRRNLHSTITMKNHLTNLDNIFFIMNIPELSTNLKASSEDIEYMILENSVHAFDLAFYLFGRPRKWSTKKVYFDSKTFASIVDLNYANGSKGIIGLTIGVPDNWSIDVFAPGKKYEMSPLENFAIFDKMGTIASTNERPNKLYVPQSSSGWLPDKLDLEFKAGFYRQMNDFREFVLTNSRPERLASLSDAKFVITFAQSLLSEPTDRI